MMTAEIIGSLQHASCYILHLESRIRAAKVSLDEDENSVQTGNTAWAKISKYSLRLRPSSRAR